MKTSLELFSGSCSFSKQARLMGFDTLTIDKDPDLKPDIVLDIDNMSSSDIPLGYHEPWILWASPPCTCFSVASLHYYWNRSRPNEKAREAINTVKKTLDIIRAIKPKYWYIENPVGMLRTLSFMRELPRRVTVTYCQYGDKRRKATDIWTNNLDWVPRRPCRKGERCHDACPRGSHAGGTAGQANAFERGKIPDELIKEIISHSLMPISHQNQLWCQYG